MHKKINRLTIILEPIEKYFQQDGHLALWQECKEEYIAFEEENDISSLSINEDLYSLNFMEQVDSNNLIGSEWVSCTIDLQSYYRKNFVQKLNWILANLKLVKQPSNLEIQEYCTRIQSLTKLAANQSKKSYGDDLLHLLRKLDIFNCSDDISDRFLIAANYSTDKIERVHAGLVKLGFINCTYSDFKNLFRDVNFKPDRSKVITTPVNWLKRKSAFGYVYSLIVIHFKIVGYDIQHNRISQKLWLFADNNFHNNGEKGDWSKQKEREKPGKLKEQIDEIFSTL